MTTTPEPSKTLVQRAPEVAGNVLRTILEFAIEGRGSIPGARAAAARTLQSRGEHEAAVDSLVMQHVGLAGAQGFLTNLGGLLTLPVALPANLAGLPAMSIPCGTVRESGMELPVGFQMMAPHFREDLLLKTGFALGK